MGVPNQVLGYWLRQWSDGNFSYQDILNKLNDAKANCLFQKSMDGSTYQGWIDNSTPISSVGTAVVLMNKFQSSGIDFCPVVVPRGKDPVGEALQHGALFKECGSGCVDLEPYAGFYDGSPLSTIPLYCQTLRAAAGQSFIVLQPDPRNLSSIFFNSIYQYFNCMAPQHYVGWEGVGWTDVNTEIGRFNNIASYGLPMMPTLYGSERTDLALAFAGAVKASSMGFQIFDLVSGSTDVFVSLAPNQVPEDPCPDLTNKYTDASARLRAIQNLVDGFVT